MYVLSHHVTVLCRRPKAFCRRRQGVVPVKGDNKAAATTGSRFFGTLYDVDDACNDDGTCECEEAPTVVLIVFLSAQLKLLFRISRSHHSHTQLTWDMHALAGEGRAWTARRRRSGARGRREAYTVFVAPFCALHWPRLCNPHTVRRLGRRNIVYKIDFTPGAPPSHVDASGSPCS